LHGIYGDFVDPPYGIGEGAKKALTRARSTAKWKNARAVIYAGGEWDKSRPKPEYFDELFRAKETRIHPTQKPIILLERLIELFTDVDDVVIDPVAGSGTTLLAAKNLGRRAYGFEIKKDLFRQANEQILSLSEPSLFHVVVKRDHHLQQSLIEPAEIQAKIYQGEL